MVNWLNRKSSMKMMALVAIFIGSTLLTSCEEENDYEIVDPNQPVELNCKQPDYLKEGDKVALISGSPNAQRMSLIR